MKTKLLALFLALIMVVSMLAACRGQDDPGNDPGNDPGKDPGNDPGNDSGNDSGNVPDDLPSYDWDVTDLIFEMTNNSNNQELSSECKRYLAGEDTSYNDEIDDDVAIRNEAAYESTNVNITYTYLPDTKAYTWSKIATYIETSVNSGSKDSPDMYCNFVYDMVNASLKGCFANLFSTVRGDNHFSFLNINKDEEFKDTGDGYMYEYMKSLTLSKHKMYCLSSDYFIDMVRAFFIVPVNISMINSIEVTDEAGKYNSDRTGDGQFTIDDFYELVLDGEWNYNTLMDFCTAISSDEHKSDNGETWNLNDQIGFAISATSGLSSSGMLYTTSIKIIERTWDDIDDPFGEVDPNEPGHGNSIYNDYMYWYPKTNDDLVTYCNNLSTLFSSNGVISVTNEQTYGYGTDSLIAIRERFAANKILFGGVICVGSLEYDSYQAMNAAGGDSGFGIVPVPLYRTVDPKTGEPDKYLTQIHNIGRIGAISRQTLKFAQCTAFLDYQSTHSTDILNTYYDFKLQWDVAGGSEGNIEMLQYIRENVRSSFDKAFEDAIGKFFSTVDKDIDGNKWHNMIKDNGFKVTDMATRYAGLYTTKEGFLQSLVREYDNLPK